MTAKRLAGLAAASAVAAWGGSALAADFTLDLSGLVADYTPGASFISGSTRVDPSFLPLSGLDASNAITVNQGDSFAITVSLDGSLTVPASVSRTDVIFSLTGSSFPNINTGVENEVVDFTNQGSEVAHFDHASTTTSGRLSVFNPIFPPNNGPLTFDKVTYSFDINTLGQPATLDGANFSFSLLSPAPEPMAWALMLVGFGGMGAVLRSIGKRAFA
jgi:hypothetical protein